MKLVQAVLARPKSRIFRVQSDFTTMLLGFRSWGQVETYTFLSKHEYIFLYLICIAFKEAEAEKQRAVAQLVCRYPVNDASRVQVPDATEDLVEQI